MLRCVAAFETEMQKKEEVGMLFYKHIPLVKFPFLQGTI